MRAGSITGKRSAWASCWLLANLTGGRMDVFTLDGGGALVLPVFSFCDEAEMYAHLQPGIEDWEPREFSPGEIVSVLYGPLAGVARVALDPLPAVCDGTLLDLLCVRRNAFVDALVGGGGASRPRPQKTRSEQAPIRPRVNLLSSGS